MYCTLVAGLSFGTVILFLFIRTPQAQQLSLFTLQLISCVDLPSFFRRSSVVLTLQFEPLFQNCIYLSVLLGRSYPVDALSYKVRTHEAGLSYGSLVAFSYSTIGAYFRTLYLSVLLGRLYPVSALS